MVIILIVVEITCMTEPTSCAAMGFHLLSQQERVSNVVVNPLTIAITHNAVQEKLLFQRAGHVLSQNKNY